MRAETAEQRLSPDLRVLDGIAAWCGGLHGSMPLSEALKALASGLGAESAAISRHHYRTEELPRTVAVYSGGSRVSMRRALCADILGCHFGYEKSGSVWFLSELRDDPVWKPNRTMRDWIDLSGSQEIVVIPMAKTRQSTDYIEFHFAKAFARSELQEIEALVPTIERSWSGRMPGLVTQASVDERFTEARSVTNAQRAAWSEPLLGMANPAGLSRAEFRVCLLLSRGLSVKAVTDELGLSENTVRSHLRAIYSKTETSNLPELLYRILTVADSEDAVSVAKRA